MKDVQSVERNNELPIEEAAGIELFYSDSAKVVLKMSAGKILRYQPEVGRTEFPEGIHVQFLNSLGVVTTDMKANEAVKYEKEQRTEAFGNVVVVNSKGERLNTEKLYWDETKELISTDEFVKITTESQVIMGEGFEADQQFTWYEVKNINGIISLEDE